MALCPWPPGLEPIVGPVKTASVCPTQPRALGQARLEPRLRLEGRVHGSSDPGGGVLADSTTLVPAWHCQAPGHKPEPPDIALRTQSPHPALLPAQPSDSRPCPDADPQISDPLSLLTSPAGSPTPSPTLPICPESSRGPGQHEATLACLTMRMSAVMAQLENSSVSPTKMQICPGETRATIRGRSARHWPQAAACTLAAGREPPEAPPTPAPGGQAHGESVD